MRRCSQILLHIAIVVIVIGATLTYTTGRRGTVHLLQGIPTNEFIDNDGHPQNVPFTLVLDSFRIDYYPGTQAPADYVSVIRVWPNSPASCELSATTLQNFPHNPTKFSLQPCENSPTPQQPFRYIPTAFSRQSFDALSNALPSSFIDVSMNHPATISHHRLFQTGFDPDLRGVTLSVNHDPIGRPVVYLGYALAAIAFLWLVARSLFRRKANHPSKLASRLSSFLLFILLSSLPIPGCATLTAPSRDSSERFLRTQVLYCDRQCPMGTVAIDFILKVHGSRTYRGLSPIQVLVGWTMRPEVWACEPMIKIKDAWLRQQLGAQSGYVSFKQLFDDTGIAPPNAPNSAPLDVTPHTSPSTMHEMAPNIACDTLSLHTSSFAHTTPLARYKLSRLMQQAQSDPKLIRAIRAVDEQVGIILMLTGGTLFQNCPDTMEPLSTARVEAEILYNTISWPTWLFIMCFMASIFIAIAERKHMSTRSKLFITLNNRIPYLRSFVRTPFLCAIIYTAAASCLVAFYSLRWYVSGRMPLANGFETLLFMSVATLLSGGFMHRRVTALVIAGCTLMVAHMANTNPQITPLVPVLNSPWLAAHVTCVMISYTMYAFIFAQALFTSSSRYLVPRLTLLFSNFLMAMGIILGSVWADASWGRYWAWDPKETCALVTLLVYSLPLHPVRFMRHPGIRRFYMVVAFACVLITFFGVNYLFGGLHSYA